MRNKEIATKNEKEPHRTIKNEKMWKTVRKSEEV